MWSEDGKERVMNYIIFLVVGIIAVELAFLYDKLSNIENFLWRICKRVEKERSTDEH